MAHVIQIPIENQLAQGFLIPLIFNGFRVSNFITVISDKQKEISHCARQKEKHGMKRKKVLTDCALEALCVTNTALNNVNEIKNYYIIDKFIRFLLHRN